MPIKVDSPDLIAAFIELEGRNTMSSASSTGRALYR
jgi:hypothetical protein